MREESGYAATIVKPIPGEFASGSSVTLYYIMKPHGLPGAFDSSETTEVRWVDPATAATLIAQTFNLAGRKRDLAVLAAVVPML